MVGVSESVKNWSKYKAKQAVDMDSNLINNVTDPSANQDAATKKYVDDNAGVTAQQQAFIWIGL